MSFTIIGTGSAYPECTKTNEELSLRISTSDEWISSRTGIKSRHIMTDGSLCDLAVKAAARALGDSDTKAQDLDLIICATVLGDTLIPSLSCMVQKELAATCPAFDVNAACTGFVYALDIAAGYFARKRAKKILVVAADAMSKLVDWNDRSTCVLFGDGAGAAVLSQGEGLLSIKISASGNEDLLRAESPPGNCPFSEKNTVNPYLQMNGKEVYKFAVAAMCGDLEQVIQEAGLRQEDIDFILPHQANLRIIETAKSKLHIPTERYQTNIERFGNTSSASIPILLDELNKEGSFKKGQLLAMAAFGGGLTTGACVMKWTCETKMKGNDKNDI
jgi:3-oxoacyl-[acyl-carrier-protein] synthase-3